MNNRSTTGTAFRNLGIITCLVAWTLPRWLMAHGPLDERIADLTTQIEREPTNASLYLERGELHRHHRDWAAALKDYDRAQGLNPRLMAVHYYRGQMFFDADMNEEALTALNHYLRYQPDQPDALVTVPAS